MSLCCFSTVYAGAAGPQASGEFPSLPYPSLWDCRHMLLHPAFMLVRSLELRFSYLHGKRFPYRDISRALCCSLYILFSLSGFLFRQKRDRQAP